MYRKFPLLDNMGEIFNKGFGVSNLRRFGATKARVLYLPWMEITLFFPGFDALSDTITLMTMVYGV